MCPQKCPWHLGKALLTGAVDIHVMGFLISSTAGTAAAADDQAEDTKPRSASEEGRGVPRWG